MVSSKPRHAEDARLRVADIFAVSALQLPVTAIGPLVGHLHEHIRPRDLPEDNGQKPRRVKIIVTLSWIKRAGANRYIYKTPGYWASSGSARGSERG